MRAVFECGKLDPQVGDTTVLAPFPLVLRGSAWSELAAAAEALAREALDGERELIGRPEWHPTLGLPPRLRRVLAACDRRNADAGPRVCRLDFHWARGEPGGGAASDGCWRVSEVNADVPGGLIEAGPLARLMLELQCAARSNATDDPAADAEPLARPPDPAAVLARSVRDRLDRSGRSARGGLVALVHATAFADDFQVMRRLGACVEELGLTTLLAAPDQVSWDHGLPCDRRTGRAIDAVIRYYPAEWLPALGLAKGWVGYFGSGPNPVLSNPATALLTQSKRWPLLWDRMRAPTREWRRMLPETRDPREVWADLGGQDWVLKPALGRVGEGVLIPGLPTREERAIRRAARRNHRGWVAQRRFESLPVPTPLGPLHVCLGVYVIDGKAAGVYGRAARHPLIDQNAWELPVLLGSRPGEAARATAGPMTVGKGVPAAGPDSDRRGEAA